MLVCLWGGAGALVLALLTNMLRLTCARRFMDQQNNGGLEKGQRTHGKKKDGSSFLAHLTVTEMKNQQVCSSSSFAAPKCLPFGRDED